MSKTADILKNKLKALDDIEGMLQAIMETNKIYPLQSNLYKILDIISRAKGEENEQFSMPAMRDG